jgi:excisionase family DNA binding protein
MAQGYYSLDEAAQILGISQDELKRMARRNEIRPFFDRGTMRFRSQEVDEKARSLGRPAGEGSSAPQAAAPASPAPAGTEGGDVFGFNLGGDDSDQVEIGQEILTGSSTSLGRKSSPKQPNPETPQPKKGDSGARMAKDSGLLPLVGDSDVQMVEDAPPSSRSGTRKAGLVSEPKSGPKKPGSKSDLKRKTGMGPADSRADSGVKLVPMQGESDSDVKIVPDSPEEDAATVQLAGSPEDSDIRIQPESGIGKKHGQPTMMGPGSKEAMQTEEIDLDAELRKADQARSKSKLIPPAPKPADAAPFELSDADLTLPEVPMPAAKAPSSKVPASKVPASKAPAAKLPTKKEDTASVLPGTEDEEVQLGELSTGSGVAHDSGINLQKVSDSGISLEKPAEDAEVVEFELKADESGPPKTDPRLHKKEKAKPKTDPGMPKARPKPKTGESVDEVIADTGSEDSSEFELTLDDSGLAPLEEESATAEPEGEKDIFETDFEMPALEDESGFEPVPIEEGDTDLESSDFDLALGDEDIAAEDESGSQVVALEDEEEADEGAATVARPTKPAEGAADLEQEEGIEDLLADEDIVAEEGAEEEVTTVPARVAAAAPPAEWGVLPVAVLLPSVILLFFVGIMSFEVLHTMWGYHEPVKPASPVVNTVTGWFLDIPKE